MVVDVELVEIRFPVKLYADGTIWALATGEPEPVGTAWVEKEDLDAGRVVAAVTGQTCTVKVDRLAKEA